MPRPVRFLIAVGCSVGLLVVLSQFRDEPWIETAPGFVFWSIIVAIASAPLTAVGFWWHRRPPSSPTARSAGVRAPARRAVAVAPTTTVAPASTETAIGPDTVVDEPRHYIGHAVVTLLAFGVIVLIGLINFRASPFDGIVGSPALVGQDPAMWLLPLTQGVTAWIPITIVVGLICFVMSSRGSSVTYGLLVTWIAFWPLYLLPLYS